MAAKAATTTIPIVFTVPEDPVKLGLVASLSRPGANLTGVNLFVGELMSKRLELLRELVPAMTRVAAFVNSANPARAESQVREAEAAGRALGLQIQIFNASTGREINAAFATLARERPDALFVSPDPFFIVRRVQLATLAARHAIPTSFSTRDPVDAGGLMSYGTNIRDAYRQAGVYAGRVLKGAKPADLPVVQSTKFELVINAETARMLGLTVPSSLLARRRRGDRMTTRRTFITVLGGAAAWPLAAQAQQPKLPTIGILGVSTPANWSQWTAAFVQRLRELGWTEGRTVAIEYRWAEGRGERFAEIAAEFVRLKVDVIVTVGSAAAAAQQVTSTIPIVFAIAVDPVGTGMVAITGAAGR